jgi:hypothetical protein
MAASRSRTIIVSLIALTLTAGVVIGVARVTSFGSRVARNAVAPSTSKPLPEPEKAALSPPRKIKPGDWLQIEVLEAFPGRPITGVRVVRSDGTISLGYYGDVQVAELDRYQIKAKVVNHMRKFLTDETLGLICFDEEEGAPKFVKDSHGNEVVDRIKPVDSDRVFVDDAIDQYSRSEPSNDRLGEIEDKLDKLTARLVELLESKPVVNAAAHDSEPKSASVSKPPQRTDSRQLDLGKAAEHENGAARPMPGAGFDPFEAYYRMKSGESVRLRLSRLRNILSQRELAVATAEKLAAEGKASEKDVAKARATLEGSKGMIPGLVREARERVEELKSSRVRAETGRGRFDESRRKSEIRLGVARKRLEEAKKARNAGNISEEEFLDAEGDFQAISKSVLKPQGPPNPPDDPLLPGEAEVAEADLQAAEQLQSQYHSDSKKVAKEPKEAKPR